MTYQRDMNIEARIFDIRIGYHLLAMLKYMAKSALQNFYYIAFSILAKLIPLHAYCMRED